jgi:hypothetical protein
VRRKMNGKGPPSRLSEWQLLWHIIQRGRKNKGLAFHANSLGWEEADKLKS